MKRAILLLVVACGRSGFDPIADGAVAGEANVAFVTSSLHTGALGGLAGADAICAQRAMEAGLDGTFVAWLSTSTTNAYSRIASSRGWRLVDGTPLADLASDFATGSLRAPIGLDERGRDVRATSDVAWTSTSNDGLYTGSSCTDWTVSDMLAQAWVGSTSMGGGRFTSYFGTSCDLSHALYCLQVGLVARVDTPPPVGRLAFISTQTWQPNAEGFAGADKLCADDAARARLPGSYRALLPTPSGSPQSRFDLAGKPWVRVDGVPLADTAAGFFAPTRRTFLDRTADGTVVGDNAIVWAGDPTMARDSCAGWTTPSDTIDARIGQPKSSAKLFFDAATQQCSTTGPRLVCLQR